MLIPGKCHIMSRGEGQLKLGRPIFFVICCCYYFNFSSLARPNLKCFGDCVRKGIIQQQKKNSAELFFVKIKLKTNFEKK